MLRVRVTGISKPGNTRECPGNWHKGNTSSSSSGSSKFVVLRRCPRSTLRGNHSTAVAALSALPVVAAKSGVFVHVHIIGCVRTSSIVLRVNVRVR